MSEAKTAKDIVKLLLTEIKELVIMLPPAGRIIVIPFIIFVLLNIVNQMFSDHFIEVSVKLLVPESDALGRAYTDKRISVIYDGTRTSMISDTDGRISIHKPMLFSTPPILIFNENKAECEANMANCVVREELEFAWWHSITLFMSGGIEIFTYKDKPSWQAPQEWRATLASKIDAGAVLGFLLSPAYAAIDVPVVGVDGVKLSKFVLDKFSKVSEKPIASIKMSDSLNLDAAQRSELFYDISKQYDITLNLENNKLNTVSDLVELTKKQKIPDNWQVVQKETWVKPKSLFNFKYELNVKGTDIKIQPIRLFNGSAQVRVYLDTEVDGADEDPIWEGVIYSKERIFFALDEQEFALKLNKINSAGFDRIFYNKAAFFEVTKKEE
ncbi:MAG: hypothetical protein HRT35_25580 [Algicola sp.]|nr:hypothetical protein [Algicola sp.]